MKLRRNFFRHQDEIERSLVNQVSWIPTQVPRKRASKRIVTYFCGVPKLF